MRLVHALEILTQDLRYASRGLQRSPGFTATVIVMLALGIGANTAIFSLVDRLLLRDLPYPDSKQVVMLNETFPQVPRDNVSPGNWLDWQRMSRSFEALAAWRPSSATLSLDGDPELLSGQTVSAEFFPALKVRPLLGRLLAAEDDQPNAARVVVLSHRVWQRRFGGDPKIIGKKIDLDAEPFEVIGVAAPDFFFMTPESEYWVAYRLDRTVDFRATTGRIIPGVVGRIKPGVSLDEAQAEMRTIAAQLEQAYAFNRFGSVRVSPLREVMTSQVRVSLLVLFGAVTVLLMIACSNVASMMLARWSSRQHEIAVRASLGAAKGAIIRQLLVESLLLAAIGGAAAFLVALWTVSALLELTPRDLLGMREVSFDRWIFLYTFGVSMLIGLTFGLAPALTSVRGSLATYLHGANRSTTHSAGVRRWLVVAQVTMTVILLCTAGLLVRSFTTLNFVRTGVDAERVLTMQFSMPPARYDRNQQIEFVRSVIERVEKLPGVQSAGATRSLPVIGPSAGTGVHFRGTPDRPPNERPMARIRIATPDYFKTVGVPLVRGREFDWDDQRLNAEPVFIVNEAFEKAYLPGGQDVLATSMRVFMNREPAFGRIIGVAADVREGSLRNEAVPTVYYNQRQLTYSGMTLFVRTNNPNSIARNAVNVIHDLDSGIAVTQVRPLSQAFTQSIARERLIAVVSAAFAATALLLASFGLYGLLSFIVAERTREIGIRMALGARATSISAIVLGHGLSLVAAGVVAGLIGAFLVARSIEALLFGIPSHDPATFGVVVLLLIAVSAIAAYVPARRATKVQPVVALRQD